jgi:L-fucose isomerase-like protein
MEELFQEIDKKDAGRVKHLETLKRKYKDHDVLNEALYIYGALKRLVKKYHLNGLTIRCFDTIQKYKNTACLALALLNDEGITGCCEGDIPCLLTMHLASILTNRPCFQANPSYFNQAQNTILFAHCTLPLSMTSKYELLTHFESDCGVAIKGEVPLGPVSILKLFINEKHNLESSICLGGTIKENCSYQGYCRTQVNVQLSEYDILTFLKEDFANHVVLTYGDVANDFFNLISIYNVKLIK